MTAKYQQQLELRDVEYVMANLDPEDRAEVLAVRGEFDHKTLSRDIFTRTTQAMRVIENGKVIAVGGLCPVWPGYDTAWMFSTSDFRNASFELLKRLRKGIIEMFQKQGTRRAEVRCMSDHSMSKRWIRFMGGTLDCKLPNYGINQEEFLQFSWVL